MAGAKGYSSYRGRGGKWKILMAIVLVLVIAVAVSVIYMQQYMVYSADGRRQIVLPWQSEGEAKNPPAETQEGDPLDNVELIVQEPEEPESVETVARSLPLRALSPADWSEFKAGLSSNPANAACNTAVVRLKTTNGSIHYESAHAVSGAVDVVTDPGGSTMSALAQITSEEGMYAIASIACLQDFKAANADVEGRGLKNTGGYIFYDGNNNLWLDPAKPATREYVCNLAKEIAELGFDELLLTDFGYPTEGKINKINYNTDVPLANNLDTLLSELNTALEPYDVLLSLEIPEKVIVEGPDLVSGLDLSRLAGRVDRVYAATTADQVETLSNLVAQAAGADGKTEFVPELTADSSALTGSRLILAE